MDLEDRCFGSTHLQQHQVFQISPAFCLCYVQTMAIYSRFRGCCWLSVAGYLLGLACWGNADAYLVGCNAHTMAFPRQHCGFGGQMLLILTAANRHVF